MAATDFGVKADGHTDDSGAIYAAIQAARDHGISKVSLPGGRMLCKRPIIDGTATKQTLPNGISFVGEGLMNSMNPRLGPTETVLVGDRVPVFDLRYPNGSGAAGGHRFENLVMSGTDPSVDIFRGNYFQPDGKDYSPADGAGNPYFLEQIGFYSCKIIGGHGPGDGLKFKKTFHLYVDPLCLIREHRRGLHMVGCDNGDVSGRFETNGRHVMNQASGTFGNNNRFRSPFYGPTDPGSNSEPRYLFYDTGRGTIIESALFEDGATNVPAFYLAGSHQRIIAPYFGHHGPLFEAGRGFIGCVVIAPIIPPGSVRRPSLLPPASWEFGNPNGGAEYPMQVLGASTLFKRTCGHHPLVRYDGDGPQPVSLTPSGMRVMSGYLDSSNFDGFWTGVANIAGGIDMELDPACRTGWRIRILNDGARGFAKRWIIGDPDAPRNEDTIVIRNRGHFNGVLTQGSMDYAFRKNGQTASGGAGQLNITTAYANQTISYRLSGFRNGDALDFVIFRNGADAAYFEECFTWEIS